MPSPLLPAARAPADGALLTPHLSWLSPLSCGPHGACWKRYLVVRTSCATLEMCIPSLCPPSLQGRETHTNC